MRTSSFEKRIEELGYRMVDNADDMVVYRDGKIVATVDNNMVNSLDSIYHQYITDELFELLFIYSSTPIIERTGVEEIINPKYDELKPMFVKTKSDRHKDLVNHIHEVYVDKNMKYGDAFAETIEKYGMIAALTRMNDKFNRVEQFIVNGYEDSEESLKDSLLDLANYCLMTVMEIDNK